MRVIVGASPAGVARPKIVTQLCAALDRSSLRSETAKFPSRPYGTNPARVSDAGREKGGSDTRAGALRGAAKDFSLPRVVSSILSPSAANVGLALAPGAVPSRALFSYFGLADSPGALEDSPGPSAS